MKRLIFVIASTLCIAFLEAQSVSKELATRIALQYLRSDISNAAPQEYSQLTMNTDVDTIYTSTFSSTGKAPLYLVQLSEGWVLVASEFVGIPILASSPIGQFPIIEDMPEGMKWLLSYYEDAMQFTRDSLSPNIDSIQYVWEHRYDSISNTNINRNNSSPLPSNHTIDSIGSFLWKQSRNNTSGIPNCDKVYNKFCPTWYNADSICYRTLVGCVAVAMGLVMRYNKWPHSARIPNTIDPLGNTSSGKHFVAYQWNRMPCTIGNSTDNMIVDEIAGFLRDCGYASKMKYGIDGSTAYLSNATDALNDIFRYENVSYNIKRWYVGNWVNKLKTEIAAGRPIIYEGNNGRGDKGHTFVLYGYDSNDKFKIHWGWGGNNNGFFALDSLIPNGHNYNYNSGAIWGITPDYPSCSSYVLLQSDVNNGDFEIYRGGAIVAQNITINNSRSGAILSGDRVQILSNFKIESGSHVLLGVTDMHCGNKGDILEPEEDNPYIHNAPQKSHAFEESPSVRKILHNGQLLIERDGKTYNAQGVLMMRECVKE